MGTSCGKMFRSKDKCSYSESKPNDHAKKNIMEENSNSKSCEVSSMMLLPEDLMIDIISRVPLKCLLNSSRYVCKPWATIIGSSHFAEAHRAHSKPGLYVESFRSKISSYFLDIKDDLNGHFERIDLGTPPGMIHVKSTCDGILLFRDYRERSFVVNPILKYCIRVPPLPTRHNCIIARVPHSAIFKLFFVSILVISDTEWYVFYVLKIGIDNSWKEIARKKVMDEHYNFCQSDWPQSVYSGGNDLYWITMRGVIVMDVDKENIVGEYPLLVPLLVDLRLLHRQFLWMENHLSCIVHKDLFKTFQIYFLDIDSGKWILYQEMGPFDYVAACGHELHIWRMRIRFWMKGQFIFQLYFSQSDRRIRIIHLGFNVKTRQLTKIEGIPVGNFNVWLHTNSLASLPSAPS